MQCATTMPAHIIATADVIPHVMRRRPRRVTSLRAPDRGYTNLKQSNPIIIRTTARILYISISAADAPADDAAFDHRVCMAHGD